MIINGGFRLAATTIFLIGLLCAYGIYSRSRSLCVSTPSLRSQSNLRMIGQGILLYTDHYTGQYPDSLRTLLLTEDITGEMLVSPPPAAKHRLQAPQRDNSPMIWTRADTFLMST
jgi:hypothetical protein